RRLVGPRQPARPRRHLAGGSGRRFAPGVGIGWSGSFAGVSIHRTCLTMQDLTMPSRLFRAAVAGLLALLPMTGGCSAQPARTAQNVEVVGATATEEERLFREAMDLHCGLTKQVDDRRAAALFEQAASKGHAVAAGHAGIAIYDGGWVEKNEARGL